MTRRRWVLLATLTLGWCLSGCAPRPGHATLTVDPTAPGHVISPLLFGDQVETVDSDGFWDQDAGAPRAAALALAQSAGVSILRYPGGTPGDFFHWAQTIGPLAQRQPQLNPFNSTRTWIQTYPVVFGPDEFAQAATDLGAQMLITANVGTGTPQEAAAWLSHDLAQGIHPRYWEVGNEVYITGSDYASVTQRRTPQEYASLFDQYASALRAVDPSVKVGALGCHHYLAISFCEYPTWNQEVLQAVTQKIDFFAVHDGYAPGIARSFVASDSDAIFRATLAAPELTRADLQLHEQDLAQYASPQNQSAPLAVTEHASLFIPWPDGTGLRQLERSRNLASALYSALLFNAFLSNAGVTLATHLKLASPYWQAPITNDLLDHDVMIPSAYALVLQLYSQAGSATFVPTQIQCDATFDSDAQGLLPAMKNVVSLDAVSVVPTNGDSLWIYAVNRDLDRPLQTTLVLGALTGRSLGIDTLDGPAYYSVNIPGQPQAVGIRSSELGAVTQLTLPAHSLTRIRVH